MATSERRTRSTVSGPYLLLLETGIETATQRPSHFAQAVHPLRPLLLLVFDHGEGEEDGLEGRTATVHFRGLQMAAKGRQRAETTDGTTRTARRLRTPMGLP